MNDVDYKPFTGDGRNWVTPSKDFNHLGRPLRVNKRTARARIDAFMKDGKYMSGSGGLLWILVEWCKANGVAYRIDDHGGFYPHAYEIVLVQMPVPA